MFVPANSSVTLGQVNVGKGKGGRPKGKGKGNRKDDDQERPSPDSRRGKGGSNQSDEGEHNTKDESRDKDRPGKADAILEGLARLLKGSGGEKQEESSQTQAKTATGAGGGEERSGNAEEEADSYEKWTEKVYNEQKTHANDEMSKGPRGPRWSAVDSAAGKPEIFLSKACYRSEALEGEIRVCEPEEAYGRLGFDWAGVVMRSLPKQSLLQCGKSLRDPSCTMRCYAVAATATEAEMLNDKIGGWAVIPGAQDTVDFIQTAMGRYEWRFESDQDKKKFKDMIQAYAAHMKLVTIGENPMQAEADRLKQETEELKKQMRHMQQQMAALSGQGSATGPSTPQKDVIMQQHDPASASTTSGSGYQASDDTLDVQMGVNWRTAQQLLDEKMAKAAKDTSPPWRKKTSKADDVEGTWKVPAEVKTAAKEDTKKNLNKKGGGVRTVKKQDSRTKQTRYLTRQSCRMEDFADEQPNPFLDATQAWQPPQSPEGDEEL